ncbi:alpha/beta hydrolase family protein [Blastomonas sp. RAC04]|uniref:alpha/beta fold hydrolase n=1 Tax=Blastomonas sp. RAC04 TaxID=1842535 RepID=UPI00083E46C0|nr:alpha/beta hydrolase [Blastomonas sp. RAC04]AOG00764.1 alpha/beta hydrolase family protein [Blastomonas sp. RAC04]
MSNPDTTGTPARETVILVPGLLCDAAIWEHQIAALSADYDVRIPDLTGQDSIAAMAAHVLADAPPRFAIAGHSMGARVALEVWQQAPERVERLALLDTAVHPAGPDELPKRQAMLDISANHGMTALADAWLPPMVKDGLLDADLAVRAALYAMVERMSPAIHRAQITALLGRPDARPLLPLIGRPVLIGVGALDRWSPPAQHEEIAAAIPHARYVVFEGSGHMAPMEAAQAVSDALWQWMHEPEGQAA